MLYIEVLLLAIGLSMDSLAVSVTSGAVLRDRCSAGSVVKIASTLGLFQAGMTVIGYTMGLGFERYIRAFDHWVAFALLAYLGGKMIYESTREKEEESRFDPLRFRTLCGLGIATSIDALAVGISLAILKSPLLWQAVIIGVVTFLMSASGVYFGNRFGRKINLKLDLIGGLILIGIGVKILVEHLCPLSADAGPKRYFEDSGSIFHTTYHVKYQAREARTEQIDSVLRLFDLSLNPFNPRSTIARVNRGEAVEVDDWFAEVFRKAEEGSEADRPLAALDNLVPDNNPALQTDRIDTAAVPDTGVERDIFIIGGGEIYRQTMPLADRLYITEVHAVVKDADTFFPEIDRTVWKEVSRSETCTDTASGLGYEFVIYERIR